MTIEQLRQQLADTKTQMEALIDAGLTEENQAKFDELEAEAKTIRANIDRLERFYEESKEDKEPSGRKTTPESQKAPAKPKQPETNGFENMADFSLAVRAAGMPGGDFDKRLGVLGAPSNFHKEGGSSDGYMVPTEFKNRIFDLMFGDVSLLSMVDSEPTSSNSVSFLADETTPWGSAGIQAYWGAEGNQFTPSRLETEGRELKVHKLHAFVTATEELIEDGPRLNQRLTSGAARALTWKANEAILFGTGAGQPLGFSTATSKVTVAKESGQAAATLNATNIAKMYSRCLNPGQSVWLINQDVLPQLITMQLGDQPIWTPPATGIVNAPGGFLLGRPIMTSEHCDTLGTVGDIMLINPMGYYLLTKQGGIKFSSSIHLYFDYDIQAFKWTFRLGGQPYLSAAVSPNKGSATRSHFVDLATRA